MDGTVSVRKAGDWKPGSPLGTQQLHDSYLGGTTAAALGTGATPWLMTAGAEGAVFVCRVEGLPAPPPASSLPIALEAEALNEIADEFDLPDEPLLETVLAAAAVVVVGEQGQAAAADGAADAAKGQEGTRATVQVLRERLQTLLAQNAAASPMERLPYSDMIVDGALKTRLEASAAAQVSAAPPTGNWHSCRREHFASISLSLNSRSSTLV
jgi:hypothetical protein